MTNQLEKPKILIVDDHPALAFGIKLLLERTKRGGQIEIAETGQQAIELIASVQPDIVLLDLNLPDMHGVDLARRITEKYQTHIIVYSGDDNWERCVNQLMDLKVSGILHKSSSLHYLEHVVEGALNGYAAIPLDIFHNLRYNDANVPGTNRLLSQLEHQVLTRLEHKETNQQIADALFVSVKTVEHYLTQIYKKLGVKSRHEAIRKFRRR